MKSLILKDLYNIGHNARSMLFILIVLAVAFIPTSGVEGYIYISTILCVMMILTTFSFDDNCKWTRYALVMPLTKNDIVGAKYAVLTIFSAIGSLFGLAAGTVGGIVTGKLELTGQSILQMAGIAFSALIMGVVFGSMVIPLVFKFGVEKSRMLILVSFLVPSGICLGVYKLLELAGVEFTDSLVLKLMCLAPFIAAAWGFAMYKISCSIFAKTEQ